jgi:hypothetical protein
MSVPTFVAVLADPCGVDQLTPNLVWKEAWQWQIAAQREPALFPQRDRGDRPQPESGRPKGRTTEEQKATRDQIEINTFRSAALPRDRLSVSHQFLVVDHVGCIGDREIQWRLEQTRRTHRGENNLRFSEDESPVEWRIGDEHLDCLPTRRRLEASPAIDVRRAPGGRTFLSQAARRPDFYLNPAPPF